MTEWNNFWRILAEIGTEAPGEMPGQARVDTPGTPHRETLREIGRARIVLEHRDGAAFTARLVLASRPLSWEGHGRD